MKTIPYRLRILLFTVIGLIAATRQPVSAAPGDLVPAFDAGLGETINAPTAAIQPDGKIIVAYNGYHVKAGTPDQILRPGLARFHADGSVDASFYPNPLGGGVQAIAVLDDGKILIGGYFTSLQPGGAGNPTFPRNYLARLNYDGTVDETYVDTMVTGSVTCITPQPDGKVLIGGYFNTAAGQSPPTRIVRLNSDGSLDTSFNCSVSGNTVQTISLDPQGNAFIGSFNLGIVNSFGSGRLAKINSNGAVYDLFDPRPYPTYSGFNMIHNIVALHDGRILFGGDYLTNFGNLGEGSVKNAGMLSAAGNLDTGFNPGPNGAVYGLTPLTDGSVIICGKFTEVNPIGTANTSVVNRIARILPNGSVDTNFNPAIDLFSSEVYHVLVGEDGRMKVVGQFYGVNGVTRYTRYGIAEIENYPTSSTLTVENERRIEWLRSGALAEIESAIFDVSTDGGTSWTTLGAGTRIPGGWEMEDADIPTLGKVRARGRFTYGYHGSSNSIGTVAEYLLEEESPPAPVPPGLITWWPGENTAWDVTGIGEGSMKNSEGFDPYEVGQIGRAFWFDGIDDYVEGRSGGMSLVQDLTIEVWVNPLDDSGEAMILSKNDGEGDTVSYSFFLRDGRPVFRSVTNGVASELAAAGDPLPVDEWTHLAYTEDDEVARRIYVNGELVGSSPSFPLRSATTGPVTIGAFIDDDHPTETPGSPFDGLVDELSLYNRALSGTEILQIFEAGKAGKARLDPARDFSSKANPNGPWHFGWLDGPATPAPGLLAGGSLFPAPALRDGTVFVYGSDSAAHLIFNPSKTDRASFQGGDGMATTEIDLAPRQFALHPSGDGDYAVLQWRAPEAGKYALSATFTGVEDSPTSTNVFLYRGESQLFSDDVDTFLGDGVSATETLVLSEDDLVTWIVGGGSSAGLDYTGVVASAVMLEEVLAFKRPEFKGDGIFGITPPLMSGKTVRFEAINGDRSGNPTMTARIQYSPTPGVPGTWIDLPGGTMTPTGDLSFVLTTSSLLPGTYAFRVATSVEGLGTTYSTPSNFYTVLAAAPYYEVELDAASGSDPTGQTTHRGDTINYTARFRNSGGLAVSASDVVQVLVRIPDGTFLSSTGTSAGYEVVHSGGASYAMWTPGRALNPVDAALDFTVANVATDVISSPNHGLEDGALVTVESTGALPGGLSAGTVYKALSTSSNQLKLALPSSSTAVNILNAGSGTHRLKRASVFKAKSFTVASVEDDLFFSAAHGLKEGNLVTVSQSGAGSLPGGLAAGGIYMAVSVSQDEFQLAGPGGGATVDVTSTGSGIHEFKRSEVWQTRTLRVTVIDPLAKDEDNYDELDYGDPLPSFARITNKNFGLGGLKNSATVETLIVNPLRLTAAPPVVVAAPLRQGGELYVDFTVRNEASYAMNDVYLRVQAPDGLTIRGGVFASGSQQPAPELKEDEEGRQLLLFSLGSLARGGARICRANFRVQYDWDPWTTIFYEYASASIGRPALTTYKKVPYKVKVRKRVRVKGKLVWRKKKPVTRYRLVAQNHARNRVERELEDPFLLTVEEGPRDPEYPYPRIGVPQLEVSMSQEAAGFLPATKTAVITQRADLIPGANPARRTNQIRYKVTYRNRGDARGEFIRVWVPIPEESTYVAGSAKYETAAGDLVVPGAPKIIGNSLIFNLEYLESGPPPPPNPLPLDWVPATPPPGSEKSFTFLVQLKPGIPVGTVLSQPGAIVSSRDLVKTGQVFHEMRAQVSIPGRMRYREDAAKVLRNNANGNIIEIQHQVFYENVGETAVNGVEIRYEVPEGLLFVDADLLDASGSRILKSNLVVKPPVDAPSGEVVFPIGTMNRTTLNVHGSWVTTSGWARVRLRPDPANPSTQPAYGEDGYRRDGFFDPSPQGSEPEGPVAESAPQPRAIPTSVAPGNVFIGVGGPVQAPPSTGGQPTDITYQLTWGCATNRTPGAGAVIFPIPAGTTYLSHSGAAGLHGQGAGHAGAVNQAGEIAGYPYAHIAWAHNIAGGSKAEFATVTVRVNPGFSGPVECSGVYISGDQAGVRHAIPGRTTLTSVPDLRRIIADQLASIDMADRALLKVGPNKFHDKLKLIHSSTTWFAMGGADILVIRDLNTVIITLGNNRIVAAGGGNIVAGGGGNIVAGGGGNIVAGGGGNIVAGGGGNIQVRMPDGALISVDSLFSNIRSIVAAGGGNIVAGGGLNLVRHVVSNDGAGLIGLDGASLIGLDGASILAEIDITNFATGEMSLRDPQNLLPATVILESVANVLTNGGPGIALALAPTAGDGGRILDPGAMNPVASRALLGQSGSAFLAEGGSTLIGLDGASVLSHNGNALVGQDLAGFLAEMGSGLIGQDGASLIGLDGASVTAGNGLRQ